MGAMSLGRWQTTQFLKKIGATSRLKVTSLGGLGLSLLAPRNKTLKANAARTNIVLRGPMCPPTLPGMVIPEIASMGIVRPPVLRREALVWGDTLVHRF